MAHPKNSEPPVDRLDHTAHVVAWSTLASILCLLSFVVGAGIGAWTTPQESTKPWLYEWQSLVGSLVGGLMTIVAATTAWLAATKQLNTQYKLQELPKTEAKIYIIEQISELLDLYDVVWGVFERRYFDPTFQDPFACAKMAQEHLTKSVAHVSGEFQRISAEMTLMDRNRFLVILEQVRILNRDLDWRQSEKASNCDFEYIPEMAQSEILSILTSFSHLEIACRRFDETMSGVFARRKRITVHWETIGSAYRQSWLPDEADSI